MNQITIAQAAKMRRVNKSTVWRWIRLYHIEAERIGSVWIVDKDTVMNFQPPQRGPKGKKNES